VANGQLTEEECKAQMRDLMIEDADGNWWMMGYEIGEWYYHDGRAGCKPIRSFDGRQDGKLARARNGRKR